MPRLCGLFRQCVQRGLALRHALFAVLQQILEVDAAMGADFVVRQLAAFDQSDQVRPRYPEEVRRLLGGELGMDRYDADRVASRRLLLRASAASRASGRTGSDA